MTLGTASVTKPGNAGLLKTKTYDFLAQNEAQVARTLGQPSVSGYVTTSAAETGQIIDLTDQGFVFLADHTYQILLRGRHSNDASRWAQTWVYNLRGGTTPLILGSGKLLKADGHISSTAVEYGEVVLSASYAVDTVTMNSVLTSAGTSIANTSTGVATITHPIARAGSRCLAVHASTDVTLNTEHRYPAVEAGVSSTTMELSLMAEGVTSSTGVVASFADVGFIDARLFILPPPSVFLTMNSNNVEVHVGYDASDLIQHYVDVFVGDPEYTPFGA